MCRFALYLGSPILISSLLTEPAHSIIHQSIHANEREEPLNGDGFGIGWYVPEISDRPAIFKDITPAWNNVNLSSLARVTRTGCLLAHVRAATPGLPVTQLNCHPFARDRLAFMHNGEVGDFAKVVRPLRAMLSEASYHQVRGSTDSEHMFALFCDLHEQTSGSPLERMVEAMNATIERVVALKRQVGVLAPAQLNLAVTDGKRAVVSRFTTEEDPERANSLYVTTGREYLCEDGVCRMMDTPNDRTAVIVASEPLSEDASWKRVSGNSLVVVDSGLGVREEAVRCGAGCSL